MTIDHLWIDPSFGASGDMILGALIAIGADGSTITGQLSRLGIEGLGVSAGGVQRCGLNCTRAEVSVSAPEGDHRRWSTIDALIVDAALPSAVTTGARATFRCLAEVEANIHNSSIDEVHFHEVGAHDAIIDIVGAWLAWQQLGEPTVSVGTFGLGHGTVTAAHGELPLPAPAVADLLIGWPTRPVDVKMETVTPTGAAILTTMAANHDAAPPPGSILNVGRGAGGRDPHGHPNVLTALALEITSQPTLETMVELTTNLDDVSPEVLAYTIERCLESGAADAWITPIVMKKGRSGQQLTVLCEKVDVGILRDLVLAETGSLGIRQRSVERHAADRRFDTVEVFGHIIRIKVGPLGAKPEFDDCAAAARATGQPLRQIQAAALKQSASGGGETGVTDPV